MRTCLSSFSDFFKDLTCVPHDTVKNVEETKPIMNEVKEDAPTENLSKEAPPNEELKNSLVDQVDPDALVNDLVVDSVYEKKVCKYKHSRATALEACIIITPLIIGVLYSYGLSALVYSNS